MRTLLSLFIIIAMPAAALAEEPLSLAESYRLETQSVLLQLKEAGIEKIGCLDQAKTECLSPDLLINAIESGEVTFKEVQGLQKPDGATRFTAFYSPADKAILLNTDASHDKMGQGFVGLHELAGAKGHPEIEYDFSKAAFALIEMQKAGVKLKPHELLTFKQQITGPVSKKEFNSIDDSNAEVRTEGGTVVGGGGDSDSLVQRLLFFKYLSQSYSTMDTGLTYYPFINTDIPIEVIESDSSKIIYIPAKKNYLGWPVKILVPRHLILKKPLKDLLAPNRAIEDIGFYFNSLMSMIPHLPRAKYKYYRNAHGEEAVWPTFFTPFHPAVMENRIRPKYNQVCAKGCQYLGVPQ